MNRSFLWTSQKTSFHISMSNWTWGHMPIQNQLLESQWDHHACDVKHMALRRRGEFLFRSTARFCWKEEWGDLVERNQQNLQTLKPVTKLKRYRVSFSIFSFFLVFLSKVSHASLELHQENKNYLILSPYYLLLF